MTAGDPPDATTAGRIVFAILGSVVGAFLLGWFLAHGPSVLRRPLLTPLAMGAGVGFAVAALLPAPNRHPRAKAVFSALLGTIAVLWMHWQLFAILERDAAVRVEAHPEELQGLALSEQAAALDTVDEVRRRRLRLSLRPKPQDYLAERASIILGELRWPMPAVWLGAEVVAAALAAVLASRWHAQRLTESADAAESKRP